MDDVPQFTARNIELLRELNLLPAGSSMLPANLLEFLRPVEFTVETFVSQGETRCFIWPCGRPPKLASGEQPQHVALLTSRMGRDLDAKDAWFRQLRLACAAARQEGSVIVAAQEAAGFQFVSRCAELFDIPIVRIVVNERISASRWLNWIVEECSKSEQHEQCWPVFVSPKLAALSPRCSRKLADASIRNGHLQVGKTAPIQDRVVSFLANQLWVLSLRRNGNWHKLIEARLADRSRPAGNVRLIDGDGSLTEPFANQLHELGAIRWCLADVGSDSASTMNESVDPRPIEAGRTPGSLSRNRRTSTVDFLNRVAEGESFLTHWTRRATGPWPGESNSDFIDSYIFSESPDRSAFGTLIHIVNSGTLNASAQGIRCGTPVISFTAVPLTELIERRHFQTHRNRWDFEHYGLCIARETLITRYSAQPVIYGDDQTWSELPPADQIRFQQATSKTRTSIIDWTLEQEWRLPSDLELDGLSAADCFLFTATIDEALQLMDAQRFPVVAIEELSQSKT